MNFFCGYWEFPWVYWLSFYNPWLKKQKMFNETDAISCLTRFKKSSFVNLFNKSSSWIQAKNSEPFLAKQQSLTQKSFLFEVGKAKFRAFLSYMAVYSRLHMQVYPCISCQRSVSLHNVHRKYHMHAKCGQGTSLPVSNSLAIFRSIAQH